MHALFSTIVGVEEIPDDSTKKKREKYLKVKKNKTHNLGGPSKDN